jgi:hypothetical protein
MTKNRIFTNELLKKIKTKISSDARVVSWKYVTLMLAKRCQELEADFRELESAFEELKNHSSALER